MIEVELPDGTVLEVDTDNEAEAGKIARRFMANSRAAEYRGKQGRVSRGMDAFGRGFADAASLGFADEITGNLGGDVEEQRALDRYDTQNAGVQRTLGQVAGSIAAPFAYLPARAAAAFTAPGSLLSKGGLTRSLANFAQGGLYSAGSAEGGASERVDDGIIGGLLSAGFAEGARGLTNRIAGAVSPNLSPDVRMLQGEGVSLTPGQALGGRLASIEDKMAGTAPIAGRLINVRRGESGDQFALGAINRAAAPIGFKVAPGTPVQEGVGKMQRATSLAYDRAVRRLTARLDPDLQQVLRNVSAAAQSGELSAEQADQLSKIMQNKVAFRFGQGGTVGGKALQQTLADLRRIAAQNPNPLGALLREVSDGLEDSAMRHSAPGSVEAFRKAREAYAGRTIVERASANAKAAGGERQLGAFTPGQLLTAIGQGDRTARRGATARGEALLQDYASAGQRVLPSGTGNSGTVDRALTNVGGVGLGGLTAFGAIEPGTAALLAAGVGATALPYTRAGSSLFGALTAPRGPAATVAGSGLRRIAPVLGMGLGGVGAQSIAGF